MNFSDLFISIAPRPERVVWRAPSDDNLILMLDNPRRDIKIVPGMMARIVDLQNVLLSYPFETEYPKSFVIKVDDPGHRGMMAVLRCQLTRVGSMYVRYKIQNGICNAVLVH